MCLCITVASCAPEDILTTSLPQPEILATGFYLAATDDVELVSAFSIIENADCDDGEFFDEFCSSQGVTEATLSSSIAPDTVYAFAPSPLTDVGDVINVFVSIKLTIWFTGGVTSATYVIAFQDMPKFDTTILDAPLVNVLPMTFSDSDHDATSFTSGQSFYPINCDDCGGSGYSVTIVKAEDFLQMVYTIGGANGFTGETFEYLRVKAALQPYPQPSTIAANCSVHSHCVIE